MSEDRAGEGTGSAPRDDEELRRVREAQEAHGGSMAPDLVDETGTPVVDPPTAEPPTADPE
jgi:hypothetical protein